MMKCNNSTSFNMTRFIVLETTIAIFTIMMVYLVVALIIYEWRKPNSIISLRHLSDLNRSLQFALKMRLQTLLGVLFVLGRFICENYELLAQYIGVCYDYCNAIVKVKVVLTSFGIYCLYISFWMRQQFFYAEPAIKHLSTPLVRAFSWCSLGFLTLALLIANVLFLLTRFYKMTERGCFNYLCTIPHVIPWVFLGTAGVLAQLTLFALFVYPILQHKSQLDANSCSNFTIFSSMIKQVAMAAAVYITSDVIALLLIALVKEKDEIIPTLAFDALLVVKVICLGASFSDWWHQLAALLCSSTFPTAEQRERRINDKQEQKQHQFIGNNCKIRQGGFQATTFPERNKFPNHSTIAQDKGHFVQPDRE